MPAPQNRLETNDPRGLQMMNNFQEDFYISVKENDFWRQAINLVEPLNSSGNEGAQNLFVDGQAMYFTN